MARYRIRTEFTDTFGIDEDGGVIQKIDSATTDIARLINLSRYGVVNSRRYGDVTVRRMASEPYALSNRMQDIGVKLRNSLMGPFFEIWIPHCPYLRYGT